MKQGSIFYHQGLEKDCVVTRFISSNNWYFKVLGTEKELKAMAPITFFKEKFLGEVLKGEIIIKAGDKVVLNMEEFKKDKVKRTDIFKSYLLENQNTEFTVKEILNDSIASLDDSPFTFWVGHLKLLKD